MAKNRVFTVGDTPDNDYTPVFIELLTYKIKEWYESDKCSRVYANPAEEAEAQIQQCLQGVTKDGKPWGRAPKTFEGRVKSKCLYDADKYEGISGNIDGRIDMRRKREQSIKESTANAAAKANIAQTQDAYRTALESEIITAYPELDTPVHRPNIKRLTLLYAQQSKIEQDLLTAKASTQKTLIDTLSTIQKTVESTMKSLDIYPDQIRKRMDQQRKGSIGDLVVEVENDSDFAKREKLWALTEALQLWWMTQHPNGNKTGPQIHEFEMWHMTRSRPVNYKCACGKEVVLVEGFTPEELKDYLIANGVLVEKSVIPQLIPENSLEGLKDLGTGSTIDAGEGVPRDPDDGGEGFSEDVQGS